MLQRFVAEKSTLAGAVLVGCDSAAVGHPKMMV